MTRHAVDQYLRGHGIDHHNRNFDEVIPLARERSPVWYCNYLGVGVAITYTLSSRNYIEALGTDTVKQITLDRQLMDCL